MSVRDSQEMQSMGILDTIPDIRSMPRQDAPSPRMKSNSERREAEGSFSHVGRYRVAFELAVARVDTVDLRLVLACRVYVRRTVGGRGRLGRAMDALFDGNVGAGYFVKK